MVQILLFSLIRWYLFFVYSKQALPSLTHHKRPPVLERLLLFAGHKSETKLLLFFPQPTQLTH